MDESRSTGNGSQRFSFCIIIFIRFSDSYVENQRRRHLRDSQGFYFPYKKYTLQDYKEIQKLTAIANPYGDGTEPIPDRVRCSIDRIVLLDILSLCFLFLERTCKKTTRIRTTSWTKYYWQSRHSTHRTTRCSWTTAVAREQCWNAEFRSCFQTRTSRKQKATKLERFSVLNISRFRFSRH